MKGQEAYERAAAAYYQAGYLADAARCYLAAGAFRRAAELYERLRQYTEAAGAYVQSGLPELGAWLLVHEAGDPAAARLLLQTNSEAERPRVIDLRHRLVEARCDLAEGVLFDTPPSVLADVRSAMADRSVMADHYAEEWSIALCVCLERYDLVMLIFAAAVRGGKHGAVRKWNSWASEFLGSELVLSSPAGPTP